MKAKTLLLIFFVMLFLNNFSYPKEKLTLKQKVDNAIEKIKSSDEKEKGLEEIQELALFDKEEKEIKRAIPEIKKILKMESKGIKNKSIIWRAIDALVLISDDEAIDELQELANSDEPIGGRGDAIYLTNAGYAHNAIIYLKRRVFEN